jgi:hypothetical protein
MSSGTWRPFLPQLLPHGSLFPRQLPRKTHLHSTNELLHLIFGFIQHWRDVNSNALFGARRWLFVRRAPPCWPFSPRATAPVYFYFKIDLLPGSRSRRAR